MLYVPSFMSRRGGSRGSSSTRPDSSDTAENRQKSSRKYKSMTGHFITEEDNDEGATLLGDSADHRTLHGGVESPLTRLEQRKAQAYADRRLRECKYHVLHRLVVTDNYSSLSRSSRVHPNMTNDMIPPTLHLESLTHPETEFQAVLWRKERRIRSGSCRDNKNGSNSMDNHMEMGHNCHNMACHRVTINVSGALYEIRLGILNQHPLTLLGNPWKRQTFYDASRKEYFFDRHRPTFEAIFNYYQYGGKLKRPMHVPDDIFLSELEFFEIESQVIDSYKREEGYTTQRVILPTIQWKRNIWMLFEYPETSPLAFIIAILSVLCTMVSIVLFCVETLPMFSSNHCENTTVPNFMDSFFVLESLCTMWFTAELIIRFIACPSRRAFLTDVRNHVDVAAVLPYYVTLTDVLLTFSCERTKGSASLAFLRVIRLIRVFKLTKHSPGLQVLLLTFRASLEGLCLFLVALMVCILVFSSTIYYAEMGVQGSQIESIPDAFWWAIITICTVGYGDKVPRGPWGKLVGSMCAVAGVLTLAIPVPILTENFNKFYAHRKSRDRREA